MATMTRQRRHPVFDLQEAGIEIMRMNLRRRHPDATDDEIHKMLLAWLRERPGAPYGDAPGVPSNRFS